MNDKHYQDKLITRIIYPCHELPNDVRYNDLIEILKTSLEYTTNEYGPFILAPSIFIPEARLFSELNRGELINVVWSSTSILKEEKFIPIRIPLRKGLLGYRIFIINRYKQIIINRAKNLEELKKFSIGQGLKWGDIQIYKQAGFHVVTAFYANLFEMLASGCFDLFPRGLIEIFPEVETHQLDYPELGIEKNLAFFYQWPFYFFVNKSNPYLAKRIEDGLHKMINDGTFEALFLKYNSQFIQSANLKNREIIKIDNPLLPPQTPLDDSSFWLK